MTSKNYNKLIRLRNS